MEGRETEWDIQGYRENGGKMNWLWEKGLTLGKRILVTGFVVSSAPVVLPPLVVLSAIGFVCTVPYGFFLASYVCTEKLMSKLLPSPMPSPVLIENGMKDGFDDYEEQEEREDTWIGGDVSTEEDQEELLEHTDGRIEARVEPTKKDKEEVNFLWEDVHPQRSFEKENVDEIVKENGYEEDIGDFVEEEEEKPRKGTEVRSGVRTEEENELLVEESGDGVQKLSAVMISLAIDKEGGNKFKEDEGPFETSMVVELCQGHDNEDDNKLMRGNENIKKIGMPLGNRNVCGSVSGKGLISVIEENTEENNEGNVDVQQIEDIGSLPDKRNVNILSNGHKCEIDKPTKLPEEEIGDQAASTKEDLPTNRQQEISTSSSSDVRAIGDESGFNLRDNTNAAYQQHSHVEYAALEGGKQANYTVCQVIESSEIIVPYRVDDSVSAEVPSQKDAGMASDQVLYNEEEMRKQIGALSAIVGYTAVPQKTCVEELRALYIVTGIEPPALLKDPCDPVEVNDKLRFLMSVVGVKSDA